MTVFEVGTSALLAIDLCFSLGLGYFLHKNLKQVQRDIEDDLSQIVGAGPQNRYFYSYMGYGVILWCSSAILLLVLASFFGGILYPSTWEERLSPEDAFQIMAGFSFMIVLVWLGFIEASIPNALVTDRGIRNCSGLVPTFHARWDEVKMIRYNRWHHKYENWFTVDTIPGKIVVRPREGFDLFAELVSTRVPEEKWAPVREAIMSPRGELRYRFEKRATLDSSRNRQ